MNIGLIIAGGVGQRMKMNVPKQFIKVLGKPIMIYTLEAFDRNENIDEVVVVCLQGIFNNFWRYRQISQDLKYFF